MSTPRFDWWTYVKGMVARYPALRMQAANDPNSMTHTGTRELEAVRLAVRQTEDETAGEDRVKLIALMYWHKTHTMHGAAMEVHVSYRTARRWNGDFIRLVAKNFGLMD